MSIPVQIPVGALPITDDITSRAELIVATLAQIFRYGTTGSTPNTPPTLYPDGENPEIDQLTGRPKLKALSIETPEQQLYYRSLAVALVQVLDVTGTGGGTGGGPQLTVFGASCPSNALVGDLVRVSGDGDVDFVDITNPATIPAIGCIIEKTDAITAKVQTHGMVQGIYAGLQPGAMYCVGRTSRPVTSLTPGQGEELFYQAIGVALDPTTLVLSPSIQATRIR